VRALPGSRLGGRRSWQLLWASSRPLAVAVLGWAALDVFDGPLVVAAFGFVVGAVPAAVESGLSSRAGHRLITALVAAAVLSAVSLTFPAGATVAVVGENGSGKTTLVKLLLGMYNPTAGRSSSTARRWP